MLPPMLNYEMEAREILRRADEARYRETWTSAWWDFLSLLAMVGTVYAVLEISNW